MYKLNSEDIDVYVVIRASFGNDIILRNYTQDKVMFLGNYKNETIAVNKCKQFRKMLEFLGAEKLEDKQWQSVKKG